MNDESNVTPLPGVKAPTAPAANAGSLSLPVDVLALATAHLAIARVLAMVANVPNSPLLSTEQRIQDMAQRLGYTRGVLESANDLLGQFAEKTPVGVKS